MEQIRLNTKIKDLLHKGTVIPAHPLALDDNRNLDEERQRRLTRYYIASGAGGVAVGVHTTQFEIRKPGINLLETVLRLAAEEIEEARLTYPFIKVAGVVGPTSSALKEAALAVKYGYNLGLVSLGGLSDYSETDLIEHVRAISQIIPIFGFYLQPAVGGRILSFNFWKQFVEIPNVHAMKVAAFNRYQTLDVVRALCNSARRNQIALYTGNDDNIVADLLTPYRFKVNGELVEKRFVGGLLGHWAVWTKRAIELLAEIKGCLGGNGEGMDKLLAKGIAVTDMNEVIFDASNSFHGCIPGIHEVLRRQGLLEGRWCLNPKEELSNGQMEEIDRIYKQYPELTDDAFVERFLAKDKESAWHGSK
ncbi:MAG: dihydrodipicolinate synthase family protein [Bacteroidetes bacterium]|nr:MAG: dihydrodipicolinate synthase family protein [Bacteroidota bacterium]